MMRAHLIGFLATALAWAGPASAGQRPVVVELFTSQGCPSCPPADAFFAELAARPDVVALSLHVDYWDYIGWEDTFASPAHTARQRGYAEAAGREIVYTPQMVINGADRVVGTRVRDVTDLIEAHGKTPDNGIALSARREDGRVHIEARADRMRDMPLVVQIAGYRPEATVAIERGENAGRVITYVNVVRRLVEVAEWDTREPFARVIDWPEGAPLAVLLQYEGFGTIEAVARLP